MINLSICIVTMNHLKEIGNCLYSIYNNQTKNYTLEVIVVDNNSSDGTVDLLESYTKSSTNFILIKNKCIKNFSENNNIAINKASGKIILILNPDTIIHENTLEYMVRYLLKNPSVGAATCKLLYLNGDFQDCARRYIKVKYIINSRLKSWGICYSKNNYQEYIMSKDTDKVPKSVDYILGACMFVKMEVFKSVGIFDERFLLYGEDTDLCYRIKQKGWDIHYVPAVSITHLYARSGAKKIFSMPAFLQIYTTFLFYAKHYWKIIK